MFMMMMSRRNKESHDDVDDCDLLLLLLQVFLRLVVLVVLRNMNMKKKMNLRNKDRRTFNIEHLATNLSNATQRNYFMGSASFVMRKNNVG